MAPPAKRRKRNVVSSSSSASDDCQESVDKTPARLRTLISSSPTPTNENVAVVPVTSLNQSIASPTKPQVREKTTNHLEDAVAIYRPRTRGSNTVSKSASASPDKRKGKARLVEKGKNADIFTFFTKQAQRQQAANYTTERPTCQRLTSLISEEPKYENYDIISDDDDADNVGERKAQPSSIVGQVAQKRARGIGTLKNGDRDIPTASQKFLKRANLSEENKSEDDTRPWAERFGPIDLEELAVHKKKVADVRSWLEAVIEGKMRQRLLLLKGAAGTGKTTTIQLLAKAMDCDILEWRNPVGSVATSDGFQSMSAQFEEFMSRGGKFGQLDICSAGDTALSRYEVKPLDRRKRLILLEEFPNTFTRSSSALQSFRSTLLHYLASNTPPLATMYKSNNTKDSVTPVVIIISETLLTTTSAAADSFTAHRLLGPEILQHPGVCSIEFNAIAPTLLAKALELIMQKESRKSGRRKTPGPLVLKQLGAIGDIRSAIGSLEFLCLRGDADGDWGSRIAFTKGKKAVKDAVALTKMEQESLELITRREASLGIFHAVGKVVYNKREETAPKLPAGKDVERLPDFMSIHARPKRSQVLVDELIDETGTDTQTFIAALHENYLLSCDAAPSSYDFSSLDHVNGCIDALSDSDLLCPSWDGSLNSIGFGGGSGGRGSDGDILRQDEISFQIAVRGLLFSLPHPVKRKAPAAAGLRTGKGGEAFKMFYPTSLKLWRMKEEIEGSIDLWVRRLIKGEGLQLGSITAGPAAFTKLKPGSVESWKTSIEKTPKNTGGREVEVNAVMSIGISARKEMLLERLPYMVIIARTRKSSSSALVIREIEKVTSFHSIGGPSDDTLDEGDETAVVGEDWATDKPFEGKLPRKRGLVIRGRGIAAGIPVQQQEQKLYLSDDDIEDD